MTRLIFDEGTEFEKVFPADSVYEHPISNRLNASLTLPVGPETQYPDLTPFREHSEFTTVKLIVGGNEIPLSGHYTLINDVSISYYDDGKQYNASIMLGDSDVV